MIRGGIELLNLNNMGQNKSKLFQIRTILFRVRFQRQGLRIKAPLIRQKVSIYFKIRFRKGKWEPFYKILLQQALMFMKQLKLRTLKLELFKTVKSRSHCTKLEKILILLILTLLKALRKHMAFKVTKLF
jgi:hypothetical protein